MFRKDRIDSIVNSCVSHLFSIFLNPKYRGPNFNFKKFKKEVCELCITQCENSFRRKMNQVEKDYCKSITEFSWDEFLKNSDVESWIENQKG
jgi:hypothetical protein